MHSTQSGTIFAWAKIRGLFNFEKPQWKTIWPFSWNLFLRSRFPYFSYWSPHFKIERTLKFPEFPKDPEYPIYEYFTIYMDLNISNRSDYEQKCLQTISL